MTLSKRDFVETEFYAYCQQQYDTARHYLKNCGKPKDDYEAWLIKEAKNTALIFGGML